MSEAVRDLTRARALAQAAQLVLEGLEGLAAIEAVCQHLGESLGADRLLVLEAPGHRIGTLFEWLHPRSADRGTAAIDLEGAPLAAWAAAVTAGPGPLISRGVAPHPALGAAGLLLHAPRSGLDVAEVVWMALPRRGHAQLFLAAARIDQDPWMPADLAFLEDVARLLGAVLVREDRRRHDEDQLDDAATLRAIVDEQTELIIRRTDDGTITFKEDK